MVEPAGDLRNTSPLVNTFSQNTLQNISEDTLQNTMKSTWENIPKNILKIHHILSTISGRRHQIKIKKQSTPQNTLQSLSWNNDNDYGGASCRLGEYITSCQHILPPFFCNRHKVQVQLQLPGTKCNCQAPSASSAFFAAFSSCAQLDHNLMGCRNKLFFFLKFLNGGLVQLELGTI